MKTTSAARTSARHSNIVRTQQQAPLASIAMFTTDAASIGAVHNRAGNTAFAPSLLNALVSVERQGYRLCSVLLDMKRTCEATLRLRASH